MRKCQSKTRYVIGKTRLPGWVRGVSTTAIITKLHGGQQVLLGERHVHLVLQGLVQNAGVGQRGSLGSLSGPGDLSSSAPPRIWWEACLPGHVFVY